MGLEGSWRLRNRIAQQSTGKIGRSRIIVRASMYAVSESKQDRNDGISRLLAYSLPSYLRTSDDTDQKCRNSTCYAYNIIHSTLLKAL